MWIRYGKRVFDFVLACVGLIVLLPLFAVVALAIRVNTPGPVFFRQERIGRGFKRFYIYKFRSMVENAPAAGPTITVQGDPRITSVGRLLRQLKLDELPQIINVLKGEMSFVGPRPLVPSTVAHYLKEFESILVVRPGITDIASVEYKDEATLLAQSDAPTSFYFRSVLPRKIKLAQSYVRHQSFVLDMKILFLTFFTLLFSLPMPALSGTSKRQSLWEVLLSYRTPIVWLAHLIVAASSYYFAFMLRFDGVVPPQTWRIYVETLPVVCLIRMLALHLFDLNRGIWRYVGLRDLLNICKAVASSSVLVWLLLIPLRGMAIPSSIFIIDGIVLISLLGGLRTTRRLSSLLMQTVTGVRRVLIVGAGNAGEMIARDMRQNFVAYASEPVAFVDDDPKKLHLRIHDVPVLGQSDDLERIAHEVQADEIIIAMPSASPLRMQRVMERCQSAQLPIRVVPALFTPPNGIPREDLENTLPVGPILVSEVLIDDPNLEAKVRGKRVLVTEIGGIAGEQLCRQIAVLQPACMILSDRRENLLQVFHADLSTRFAALKIEVVAERLFGLTHPSQHVIEQSRPDVVFHASAYRPVALSVTAGARIGVVNALSIEPIR
jgi:lipopolysaccharide/colanic/teichoic acid biosynthesis glycosyltransferase